ncbi:MAG: hypothetical protein V3U72_01475, partial [Candidatus Aenigmarchaeota archaeon]
MREKVLKTNLFLWAVLIFVISVFLLFPGSAIDSVGGNFTVTPKNISFNWTLGAINITSNVSDSFFRIQNESTGIQPQYFNEDNYSAGDYDGYDSDKIEICFTNGMAFVVQNASSGT